MENNNEELLKELKKTKKNTPKYEKLMNQIIKNNINLVKSRILRKYGRIYEDLLSEGIISLLDAIEKFDVNKGTKFSTYAVWWIDQAIDREFKKTSNWSKIPFYKYDGVRHALKLLSNNIYEPTIEEIAKETGYDEKEIKQILDAQKKPMSFNFQLDDSDSEISDIMEIDNSIEEVIDNKIIKGEILEIIERALTEKQRNIIILRYGLYDGEYKTLEEVGKYLGITREGVRQQEEKALRILKKYPEMREYAKSMGQKVKEK